MANSHPGSYCGQDAYNDMFVTEKRDDIFVSGDRRIQGIGASEDTCPQRLQGCNRLDYRGGTEMSDENYIEKTVVRRLTPKECERLQGFPDNWTLIGEPSPKYDEDGNVVEIERYWTDENGKRRKLSDTPRYKALGNSIAVGFANNESGFWMWLLKQISAQYERKATMGSLFSGIGGFDLAWVRFNGSDSVLWSSEIEEFPIAVMKKHFGDEDAGIIGDIKEYL